jgi:hypothetical protein
MSRYQSVILLSQMSLEYCECNWGTHVMELGADGIRAMCADFSTEACCTPFLSAERPDCTRTR